MKITTAAPSDLNESVGCLAKAFAQDPITGFLLPAGPGYRDRLTQFFSLLMRARIALEMPVPRKPRGRGRDSVVHVSAAPAGPR